MMLSSLGAACANQGSGSSADPSANTAEENAPQTTEAGEKNAAPEEGTALPESVPQSEEETAGLAIEGEEGKDEGLAQALAENPADPETAAPEAPADGVAQTNQALLSTRGSSLASEARRIAGNTNRSTSYYAHSTYMNESNGTRRTDCSGLVAYVISRKSASGYALLPTWEGSTRPLARDYFNYLKGRPSTASTQTTARWRRILKPADLKPGDIVAYAYSSGQTTGHVMMVKELPYKSSRAGEWIVPIVDSAMSGHASDTRGSGDTGPGTGRLGIKVNSSGTPTGYYWKGGTSTTLNTTTIVMGRLE